MINEQIRKYFNNNPDKKKTTEELALEFEIARETASRYLNKLTKTGFLTKNHTKPRFFWLNKYSQSMVSHNIINFEKLISNKDVCFLIPKKAGVYAIHNNRKGITYIGASQNLFRRIKYEWIKSIEKIINENDREELQKIYNRISENENLLEDMRKDKNFSDFYFCILEYCKKENLSKRETFWINKFIKANKKLYNQAYYFDKITLPEHYIQQINKDEYNFLFGEKK